MIFLPVVLISNLVLTLYFMSFYFCSVPCSVRSREIEFISRRRLMISDIKKAMTNTSDKLNNKKKNGDNLHIRIRVEFRYGESRRCSYWRLSRSELLLFYWHRPNNINKQKWQENEWQQEQHDNQPIDDNKQTPGMIPCEWCVIKVYCDDKRHWQSISQTKQSTTQQTILL